MSEVISKSQQVAAVVADPSIAPRKRVEQALTALSGLSLSDLSTAATRVVEAELAAVNHIMTEYEVEAFDNLELIADADIEELLERIQTATQAAIDSEVERVMTGLHTAKRKLPEADIQEVRRHPDVFVPPLMEAVERAVAETREGNKVDGQTHFFAAFLLTELEVDEAFPVLLEGFKLRGEGAFDLFGDAVHELLPRALALFSRNGTYQIDQTIQDTSIDMYVRWAALSAYKYMVRDGKITRDAAVAKLDAELKRCIAEKDHDLIAPIICELSDLAAEESLGTIRSAYDQDVADDSIVDLEFVESQIADAEQTLRSTLESCRPTGVPDTIAELNKWASFRQEPTKPARPAKIHQPQRPVPTPNLAIPATNRLEPVGTVRSDKARVGRNDPCPCGSGKKFKKCCR